VHLSIAEASGDNVRNGITGSLKQSSNRNWCAP